MSEVTWVPVYIIRTVKTDLAILVGEDEDDEDPKWIPKSQISDSTSDIDDEGDNDIEIPVWLATKEGLI